MVEQTIVRPIYRTLCWALNELAKYEKKGMEKFYNDVYQPPITIMHHSVTNEHSNDRENTEFLTLNFPKIEHGWFGIELGIEVEPPKLPLHYE